MRRPVKLGLIASLSTLVIVSGSLLALRLSERSEFTDTQSIRVDADAAPVRSVLWQPATPIPSGRQVQGDEYEPRISSDGTTMVFVRGRPGSNPDIYSSHWSPAGWSLPEPIASVNTPGDELGPELSRDGQSLYFYSDREGGLGGYDVWVSRLDGQTWGSPANLGPAINSSANEYGPALSPDGKRLYFASNRLRPDEPQPTRETWTATVREARGRHDYDLYASALVGGTPSPSTRLRQLCTPADEGAPTVAPGGDFLYFASDRTGSGAFGGFDLYRVRLLGDTFSPIENLGAAINSIDDDLDPALSSDGFRLFFSSNRETTAAAAPPAAGDQRPTTGGASPPPQPGHAQATAAPPRPYALWGSTSREVFLERDRAGSRAALLALWNSLWPWLLLLLFTGLLAWTLATLLRSARWRRRFARLSLLAQCLLISIALHILIGGLLAIWQVGSKIGEYIGHGGGNRVVLASSGASGSLSGQIRSMISSVQTPMADLGGIRAAVLAPTQAVQPLTTSLAEPSLTADAGRATMPPVDAGRSPAESLPNLSMIRVADAAPTAPSTPAPSPADAPVTEPTPAASSTASDLQPTPHAVLDTPALAAAPAADLPPVARTAIRESSISPAALDEATARPPASATSASARRSPESPTLGAAAPTVPAAALPPSLAPESAAATEPRLNDAGGALRPSARRAPVTGPTGDAAAPARVDPTGLPGSSVAEPSVGVEVGTLLEVHAAGSPRSGPSSPPSAGPVAAGLLPRTSDAPVLPRLPGVAAPTGDGTPAAGAEPALASAPAAATPGRHAPLAPATAPGEQRALERAESPALPSSVSQEAGSLPGREITDRLLAPGGAEESARDSRHVASAAPASRRPGLPALPQSGPLAVSLPAEEAPPVPKETFQQRAPEVRADVLGKMGGSAETERAVGLALDWFVRHQESDGRWTSRTFDDRCGACGGNGEVDSDAAMTGITLLCFLGAGHTHTADGPYKETVAKAIAWLLARQETSGDVRRGETMYSQTVATVALCEALAMTRDPKLAGPTRRAVAFLDENALKRTPRGSGAKAVSDNTSVLGWQVMAIKSARRAGIEVSGVTNDAARSWLDYVRDAARPGRYAYRRGDAPSPAMTAEAMFVQQLLGHTRDEAAMKQSAEFILTAIPRWTAASNPPSPRDAAGDPAPSTYYWYYATLALFQHQGESWKTWNEALVPALLSNQHAQGPAAGSWDPQDQWSRLGGRVYQTAICTLSLEVYYRYRPEDVAPPATEKDAILAPSRDGR